MDREHSLDSKTEHQYNDLWVTQFVTGLDIKTSDDMKSLVREVQNHLPKKLYRYRPINDRECSTIIGEWVQPIQKRAHVVYASHPSSFNDPDTVIYLPPEMDLAQQIFRKCRDYLVEELGEEAILRINSINNETEGRRFMEMREYYEEISKKKGWENTERDYQNIVKRCQTDTSTYTDFLYNRLFDGVAISCFTQTYTSSYLWDKFGDHDSGMCLEYDMDLLSSKIVKERIFPVYYSDNENNISDILLDSFPMEKWNTRLLQVLLTKKQEFYQEKEWRFIHEGILLSKDNENPEIQGILFPIVKPSTIYLGCQVSEENKSHILELAKPRGIRVVQLMKNGLEYSEHLLHAPPESLNRLRLNPPLPENP